MIILSTTLLSMQALLMPIGMVYGETTVEQTEKQEQVELPALNNYLGENKTSEPQFFFSRSLMEGMVKEKIMVSFFSDQEVTEASIFLPKEANLVKEQLPSGTFAEQGEKPDEWMIKTKHAKNTFVLPIIFDTVGRYEISVEEAVATIEINEQKGDANEKQDQEMDPSEVPLNNGELDVENLQADADSSEPLEQEKSEPTGEDPKVQSANEEDSKEETQENVKTFFDGETAEVTTMAEFREAVAAPEIGTISVQANLTETTVNIMKVDRPLLVQGNGYTLTFGNNGFYFQLAEVSETTTFRIENAVVTKVGATPLVNAAAEISPQWVLEIEDLKEIDANTMRLAAIPEGTVQFTGGTNTFIRTSSNQTFIEAKEVKAINQAQVTISRGNATVFLAATTVSNPKITIENGAKLAISTASGIANTIDFRGANAGITLQSGGSLAINTVGTTAAPTDIRNNTIALTGAGPKIMIRDKSKLEVASTAAKRGLHLSGNNPQVIVDNSELSVTSATQAAVNLVGSAPLFSIINGRIDIRSTTGQRLNLVGDNPQLSLDQTQLSMIASSGRGIYLQGATPQVLLNEGHIEMTDSGASQGMILQGTDALLSLKKNSTFNISGGGTGTTENIQIGNNNLRPKVLIDDHSSLKVKTTSGTGAASVSTNNILNLYGREPELQVLNNSKLIFQVDSGNRRGILLEGADATTQVKNSQILLELNGDGVGYHSVGSNNALNIINSEWTSKGIGGKNIYIQGHNGSVDINSSANVQLEATTAGSIWLSGNAPKLSVSDDETILYAKSSASAAYTNATIYLGNYLGGTSSGAEVNIKNNASVEVVSDKATTIGLWSQDAQFNLTENADLKVKQGVSSEAAGGAAAALRFMNWGNSRFTVDNSTMRIESAGGSTPALRMYAANNDINVINGGEFTVYNPGDGTPSNGGSAANNQGISYSGGINNSFTIEGIGSSVNIVADNGPALDMGALGSPTLEVKNGGIFRAEGRTSTAAGGIFTANILNVTFDNPLYMNFQNNHTGGGNIFNVNNGSLLKATNSDMSVWRNGKDFDDEPDLDFRSIDYSFSGVNFNTLGETNVPDQLNTEVFGTNGITEYSRLSSNNARWAIADELRVPTNADKKIYGHVSIPVGVEGTRSAWNDEAIATLEVIKQNGDKQEYTAKTVGHSDESKGLSIYGEESRGGLFEVQLDEPLEAGSKVRISKVELSSGELTTGFDHQILTETVEVFPIVPPKPATFASSIITRNSQKIEGFSENPNVLLTATHNGQAINTEHAEVNEDGKFTIDLSELQLTEEDEIQVFLRDKNGSAKAAGIVNPPLTNDEQGNVNPAQPLDFHDVTFAAATILTVGDWDPVAPVDPLDPENEVLPENKPDLPEEQGPLSIDFVSRFNFGQQNISVKDKTYYAQPQRLLNENGTVNETQSRPNFIQISDRRPENERHGWVLSVTQNGQFTNPQNHQLKGARLQLTNQQLAATGEPNLNQTEKVTLLPGEKTELLTAKDGQGAGTWIYRFGDKASAGKSVALEVPPTAAPKSTTYQTNLTWELSSVPDN